MINVVILAGGSISSKLGFLRSGYPSPALLPVNTRPLAAYLIDFYAEQGSGPVRLVVNADTVESVHAGLGMLQNRYHLFPLGQTSGVVESLTQAVADLPDDDEVIVNVVTTVPTRLPQSNEVMIASETSQTNHWSGVIPGKRQTKFSFKSSPLPELSHAFTGVFRCSVSHLKMALAKVESKTDLLAVVVQLQACTPLHFVQSDWIDCGHETNYYEAKAKLISSRSFNSIQVSLDDGIVTKQSRHGEKLAREIKYIEMLPAEIKVYYPRILTWQPGSAGIEASVKMEYYGYPTVAEYFLYWDLSSDNWRRLFARLQTALRRFTGFPYCISEAAFMDFYLGKTVERIDQYLGSLSADLRLTLEGETRVNGTSCRPFATLVEELRRRLAALYRDKDFCVMHGDFCFNNILYDVPSGIVRLIDPRGSFGERCVGIYGDQKYDLAKLRHSAEFGYDFLVNGLFALHQSGAEFTCTLATRACGPLVAELSSDLVRGLGYELADTQLLTSLLFLSMCPLHAEDPLRQLAMYTHGLRLLNLSLNN